MAGNTLRKWKVTGTEFILPANYELLGVMGSGAYGTVVAAKDAND